MNFWTCASVILSISASDASPLAIALALIRSVSRPRPSSAISMMMWPPSWQAESRIVPRSGLPAARRSRRHLEAVVGGIAHHVGQRILDEVEHLAVELGVGAVHLELDRLAELGREVAHDPRQLLPGIADRLHARLQHAFLQLGGDVREPLQRRLELGILVPADDLDELVAREHQLGDHGHQLLERVDMDADRLAARPWRRCSSSLAAPARRRLVGAGCWRAARALASRVWRLAVGALAHRPAGRVAERALELVERTSPGAAAAPAPATPACRRRRIAAGRCGRPCARARSIRSPIVARPLGLVALELVEQHLDAVDGGEDERDGFAGDRRAIAEIAHQGFGGVGQRFEPRQSEKAAGPLDGVNEAKDVAENLGVVRILLEANQLHIDNIKAFARLREEFAQQIVHGTWGFRRNTQPPNGARLGARSTAVTSDPQCVGKRFNFGCGRKRPHVKTLNTAVSVWRENGAPASLKARSPCNALSRERALRKSELSICARPERTEVESRQRVVTTIVSPSAAKVDLEPAGARQQAGIERLDRVGVDAAALGRALQQRRGPPAGCAR